MKPASQVSGMGLNCADQKGRMQSDDCYEGFREVPGGTRGASIRTLPGKSRKTPGRAETGGTLVTRGTGREEASEAWVQTQAFDDQLGSLFVSSSAAHYTSLLTPL